MNIEIREYRNEDYNVVNEMLKESFGLEKNSNSNDSNCIELVASLDGVVRGYLVLTRVFDCVRGNYYMLMDYVCVDSNYRRLGIGKTMVNYAINYCREEKMLRIDLSSRVSRVEAHKLYERCGFIKRDSFLYRKELL